MAPRENNMVYVNTTNGEQTVQVTIIMKKNIYDTINAEAKETHSSRNAIIAKYIMKGLEAK